MDPSDPPQSDRLHALDAVRAFALLLGIVLHSSLSFLPGGYFVIEDNSPSKPLRIAFYVIHIFRMTAFFLIAGFFARLMLQRRGTAGFIKNRSLRIALVLIVGWTVCTVLVHFVYGWAVEQRYGPQISLRMLGWPFLWLTHLWFLYYLLWMYAIALAIRALWVRIDRNSTARHAIDRAVRYLVTRNLAPLAAALPVACTLYRVEDWYAWGGIPTPDRWLLPQAPALICFGIAFGSGWLLQRQADLLRIWERRWLLYLAAAIAFVALSHFMLGALNTESGLGKGLYALSYALATWTATIALLGLGTRFFANESPTRRYLADSSYWLYVAHIPLVFALQTAVMNLELHWSIKFSFILLVTCGVLLLIYHYWVRPTWIGAFMNGRKYPRTERWWRINGARQKQRAAGSPAAK